MFASSARRQSLHGGQGSAADKRHSINAHREKIQMQQKDLELRNQLKRQRRNKQLAEFNKDKCRRVAHMFILPSGFIAAAGAIITMCSCVSPVGRGTIFWESPHRHIFRVTGASLLLIGSIFLGIAYICFKKIRTGEKRIKCNCAKIHAEKLKKERQERLYGRKPTKKPEGDSEQIKKSLPNASGDSVSSDPIVGSPELQGVQQISPTRFGIRDNCDKGVRGNSSLMVGNVNSLINTNNQRISQLDQQLRSSTSQSCVTGATQSDGQTIARNVQQMPDQQTVREATSTGTQTNPLGDFSGRLIQYLAECVQYENALLSPSEKQVISSVIESLTAQGEIFMPATSDVEAIADHIGEQSDEDICVENTLCSVHTSTPCISNCYVSHV